MTMTTSTPTKRVVVQILLVVLVAIGALSCLPGWRQSHDFLSRSYFYEVDDNEYDRQLQDGNATFAPTAAPTISVTEPITPSPTVVADTPSPTIAATPEPTPFPTTSSPTVGATTLTPTAVPTVAVTDEETLEDTPEVTTETPTDNPDPEVTPEPTPQPVPSPTRAPVTRFPTLAPFEFSPIVPAEESNTISEATIIGIAAAGGGCLLLLAAAILVYNRKKSTKDNEDAGSHGKSHCDTSYTNTSPQIFVPQFGGDEVSTLGDPAGLYGGASRKNMFEGDDACSLNTSSMDRMCEGGIHGIDPESLRDAGECFDVRLPAGKAGVVLEEGPGGYPVVHSVKPGSPLFKHIHKGDRLCSIEGVDCTGLSPHDVAKKLQANENADTRILTFSRSVL